MEYTTQMDAARKGIATPRMKIVAEKERMPLEKLMELIRENRETEAEELLRTLGGTAEEPEWER